MKQCLKCCLLKPLAAFGKRTATRYKDGRFYWCKECCRKAVMKSKLTKKGKAAIRNYHAKKRLRLDYKPKIKARNAVNNAIRDGKLVRQPCQECGLEPAQAHHEDYAKPLEVEWLCDMHHRKRDL